MRGFIRAHQKGPSWFLYCCNLLEVVVLGGHHSQCEFVEKISVIRSWEF